MLNTLDESAHSIELTLCNTPNEVIISHLIGKINEKHFSTHIRYRVSIKAHIGIFQRETIESKWIGESTFTHFSVKYFILNLLALFSCTNWVWCVRYWLRIFIDLRPTHCDDWRKTGKSLPGEHVHQTVSEFWLNARKYLISFLEIPFPRVVDEHNFPLQNWRNQLMTYWNWKCRNVERRAYDDGTNETTPLFRNRRRERSDVHRAHGKLKTKWELILEQWSGNMSLAVATYSLQTIRIEDDACQSQLVCT